MNRTPVVGDTGKIDPGTYYAIDIVVTRILENGNIIVEATGTNRLGKPERKRQWVVLPDLYVGWVGYAYEKWMEGPGGERPSWAPKNGAFTEDTKNIGKGRCEVVFTFTEDVTAKKRALIAAYNDRVEAFNKREHEAVEQALRELE